ncbi:hypothetical protein VIBNISO65_830020 [Vibrio nigripulchritudo SO65]|uniref:hypothetical protein n=1 Tax=Vibrio nigripulchritudo TaxID=28173 RepID=UPI0003B1D21C|nr:hypothetical protein [Vibrio nigripulchritudo]CCN38208.1 hypothetical protein VIBNIAM115_840020 [Vibrio nigripulchritudo AM115]CCN42686.1 hypothetical protein VIBNIFTn2_360020 [Vibrio nigripulchritudo FTn2]CCN79082.1 hypothetical protein VIBNISO65_830020 [Vibrio nigripulchritudo SO65]
MKNSESKGHLRNLAIASISAVPVVGGPVSFLLDKYVPDYLESHRSNFVLEVEKGLESLEKLGVETDVNTERFISTLIKCINISDGEINSEKLSALRAVVLNSSLPTEKEFDENSLFIRLLETLTSDQIRILKAIQLDSRVYLNEDSDIFDVLSNNFPSVDKDYISVCSQELVSWNLIASRGGSNAHRTRNTNEVIEQEHRIHYLSGFGQRFYSFITAPYGV